MIVMKKIYCLVVVLFIWNYSMSQPPGWSEGFNAFGFNNHIVAIQGTAPINFDNGTIAIGDYIGAFYDSAGVSKCGGFTAWTGTNNAITVWADTFSVASQGKLGFDQNEFIQWKIWRASDGATFDVTAQYNVNLMTPDTLFNIGGLSEISSLTEGTTGDCACLPTIDEILIYPNPVNSQLHFNSSYQKQLIDEVLFFNLTGEIVKTYVGPYKSQVTIDVTDLPAGQYLLRINNNLVRKVVKY